MIAPELFRALLLYLLFGMVVIGSLVAIGGGLIFIGSLL